jgi:hypothetical protein
MDLTLQSKLFHEALNRFEVDDDLTNQVLEVSCSDDDATVRALKFAG